MTTTTYPGLAVRVKAIITDSFIMMIFIIVTSIILSKFNTVSDSIRISAFIFIFFLYDPLFTSLFGGTLGHMAWGLRVKRENNETKKIYFHVAIIRFIIKATLGWISLLTITGNNKGKAIHDYIAGSIVIFANSIEKNEETIITNL